MPTATMPTARRSHVPLSVSLSRAQVQQSAFTVTASHPLIWCLRDGTTVRCVTVAESAVLMGFPPDWRLPQGSRAGLRAVGNAVPPPLAAAVMACAARSHVTAHAHGGEGGDRDGHGGGSGGYVELASLRRKLRRLTKRVSALERSGDGPAPVRAPR